MDSYETSFGIRTIEFNHDLGFMLNGQKVTIKGVCMHHDLGALGAAFNEVAAERQLRIMKEMGANAIRTSHNPPAPELVALCDRMGLMMQLELADTWQRGNARMIIIFFLMIGVKQICVRWYVIIVIILL